MPEEPNTLDLRGLVRLLSVPEYPEELTEGKARPLARKGVFEKYKRTRDGEQYHVVNSIRGYVKHLLAKVHGDALMGSTELGQYLNISPMWVGKLRDRGIFEEIGKGRYSRDKCRIAYILYLRGVKGEGKDKDTESWAIEKQKWAAKKAQLQFEELEGQLVRRDDVIQEAIGREMAFKKAFMNLPRTMSNRLVGCGVQEIQAVLTKAVTEAFRKLTKREAA